MKFAVPNLTAPSKSPALEVFEHLRKATSLVVLDHGRAGNYFFVRLFDQHPEVLVIPPVGYFPFHMARMFGNRRQVPGTEAFDFLLSRTDFKYVAQDMCDEIAREYARLGDIPSLSVNRGLTRKILGELLKTASHVSRTEVVAAMHTAYAIGSGRNVSRVKYILMNDQPLQYRVHLKSKISQVYESQQNDFRGSVFIHLVRDPRAVFASLRHQFVRQNNGMYPFTPRGLLGAIRGIFFGSGAWCVFTNILSYTTEGSRELFEWRNRSREGFYVVRNEDLNRQFTTTMKALTERLNIGWFEGWSDPKYVPTSCGMTWQGAGAYNGTYQQITERKARGLNCPSDPMTARSYRFSTNTFLRNDPGNISSSLAGPNRYVTERWRSRLTKNEIALVEAIYYDEMVELGYDRMYVKDHSISRLRGLIRALFPLSGELFSLPWFVKKFKSGFFPSAQLLVETFLLAVYYLCSRLALFRLYFTGKLNPR